MTVDLVRAGQDPGQLRQQARVPQGRGLDQDLLGLAPGRLGLTAVEREPGLADQRGDPRGGVERAPRPGWGA